MGNALGLTIAICTWNRATSLRNTLVSLQQLNLPPKIDLEVLIINNNCTDNTEMIVNQLSSSLPLRLLHETRQGQSNARNCAVQAAKGDYILWTDDDVIVDHNWLIGYVNAFRAWPNAALFGGPIKPALNGKPPFWLAEMLSLSSFDSVYAKRDLGVVPIRLNWEKDIIPYGANMCIRAGEQKALHYNPNLGRCKNGQVRGEESAVIRTLLDSGAEGWWVPDAVVHHVITQNLQTQAHLRRYFMGVGRQYARETPRQSLDQAMRWLPSAIIRELRFRVNRLVKQPKIWLEDLRTTSITWGLVLEHVKSLI
jgi:glycosyltransferase involved in cell wall biosynthesis